jgi:hypothetical protein
MLYLPEVEPQESSKSITLLLPWYLDEAFIHLFNSMGFSVIHSYSPEVLEREINQFHIDLALEWQHGPQDYPIRNMLRKCNKNVPIFLCLNWNGRLPPNFPSLGYRDYLKVPWKINELMSRFYEALPESKKPELKDLWEKTGRGKDRDQC